MALTQGQRIFAQRLASRTGLNSRVISAWMLAEENGGAAASRQASGNHNWLNIGYFDSGPGGITKDQAFHDPRSAADATAKFLEGKWGGASTGIRSILRASHGTPGQQIAAIARSGWATNPRYGAVISSLWSGGAPAPGADSSGGGGESLRMGATRGSASVAGGDREARRAALQAYVLRGQGDPREALLTLGKSLHDADAAPNSSPAPRAHTSAAGGTPSIGGKSPLFELFYDPQGGWKNGQSIGPIGGHSDHVHVAAGPKTLIALGEHAEKLGLRVGENRNFGDAPEPGVHVAGSYHYRKGGTEAIDVSGTPQAMGEFAAWVRRVYKLH